MINAADNSHLRCAKCGSGEDVMIVLSTNVTTECTACFDSEKAFRKMLECERNLCPMTLETAVESLGFKWHEPSYW